MKHEIMFELPHDKVNNGSDYKSMACTRDLEYKRIYLKAKLVILDDILIKIARARPSNIKPGGKICQGLPLAF